MAPALENDLTRIGRMLIRGRAMTALMIGVSIVFVSLWLFGMVDVLWQWGRVSRSVASISLLMLAGATVWFTRRVLLHRFSPMGVAAAIEREFPQLDNHLINYLQFSRERRQDVFKSEYLQSGMPLWQRLDMGRMKNRKAEKRGMIMLAVSLLMLLGTGAIMGRSYAVAMWRVVNPFSDAAPLTQTMILGVRPGDATVLQGSPLVLSCEVQGRGGHEVWLDLHPADSDKTTYVLGKVQGGEKEEFAHRIARMTTGARYRFRAGDAPPTPWATLKTRPPPALTSLRILVRPPSYTGLGAEAVDGFEDEFLVPRGSLLEVEAACNTPLVRADLAVGSEEGKSLARNEEALRWTGAATVTNGSVLTVSGEDVHGTLLEQRFEFTLVPDRAPVIEILSPGGRTVLGPGEHPRIEFRVVDDYGVANVVLEEVPAGTSKETEGEKRAAWDGAGQIDIRTTWQGGEPSKGVSLAYRVVAQDNCPFGENLVKSHAVIFKADSYAEVMDRREQMEQKAFAAMSEVIDLQRQNIAKTKAYLNILARTTETEWGETAERQGRIRELTRELLTNPLKPLGSRAASVGKLYVNEMETVIPLLASIPRGKLTTGAKDAGRALQMEEKILRVLTSAEIAAGEAKTERAMSGMMSMLRALIRGETRMVKRTREFEETGAAVSETLVDEQDELATDLTGFVAACRRESGNVAANDAAYAAALTDAAQKCEDKKIRDDMMLASDRLDQDKAADAITYEERALAKLKEIESLLDNVQMQEDMAEKEDMLDAVEEARLKMEKIRELHERMIEAMDAVRGIKDKNDEQVDMMEEAYEELLKNTEEAMLEIPVDLHAFMDLNVANDLVEDVFGVFQEVEEALDEEGNPVDAPLVEIAFAKAEELLEGMEQAEGRLDDMEMWLGEGADREKVTEEGLDREEMPEAGMALGALAAEVEDLIGDLLKQSDEAAEEADDGASTFAMPDAPMGWEVVEGETVSFAAKGKSGNEAPDHKEQDGRSNVGRQGMSVGETAAGSGTIGEGDQNIEERRTEDPTQSGQVDLDGEADTKATGGGKQATGKADDVGMGGGVDRMDSTEQGSLEGMEAMMAQRADDTFARASMKNLRVGALADAAHHLRQSTDAIARGEIGQIQEHRKLALSALKRAKAELSAGPSGGLQVEGAPAILDNVVDQGPDLAPAKYRDQVAEYYKALNDAL